MTDFALTARVPSPTSTTDQTFQALYDAVITLQLPPGTRVSEAEIARQLGVSRQPVRDAFFRLSNLGFLSIRPQRATLITPISEQAVRDAMFTRTAIEVECLRVVINTLTPDALQTLRDILTRQAQILTDNDKLGFYAMDEAFHEALCKIAGHAHAWTLIREQKAHMDRIRFLTLSEERRSQVLAEHQGFFDLIEAGDKDGAEKMLRAHLYGVGTALKEARRSHPKYFETE